jgi:Putative Flp pilus-assembly TadE/G-like
MRKHWLKDWADDRGVALPFLALILVLLLGMAAFAVDLGWIFLNSARLQRAADSAALAGVIFLPSDTAEAGASATDGANANGWSIGTVNGVSNGSGGPDSLDWAQLADNRLSVTLSAEVPTFFLKVLGFNQFQLSRTATAEYIKPVPIGSPYNYFGTGSNNFWASINGKWTAHMQGDPYNARCDWTQGTGTGPGSFSDSNCVDSSNANAATYFGGQTPATGDIDGDTSQFNAQFDGSGYYYGVELPGPNSSLQIQLYDPRFQRPNGNGCGTTGTNPTGDCDRLTFGPSTANANPIGPTTRARLYAPDSTPLDPKDNTVLLCDNSWSPTTNSGASGVNAWANLCTLSNPTAGIYVLRVSAVDGAGSNQYGIQALLGSGATAKVYGINNVSIYTNQGGSTAQMYLAEIAPVHAGKTLQLSLYDAGEDDASASYTIKRPDGTTANCDWQSQDGQSGSFGACTIQTTRSSGGGWEPKFNAQWLTINVEIPDAYSCNLAVPLACWWSVSIVNNQPHDRTTWSAQIIGNPVRLVPNP